MAKIARVDLGSNNTVTVSCINNGSVSARVTFDMNDADNHARLVSFVDGYKAFSDADTLAKVNALLGSAGSITLGTDGGIVEGGDPSVCPWVPEIKAQQPNGSACPMAGLRKKAPFIEAWKTKY